MSIHNADQAAFQEGRVIQDPSNSKSPELELV